MLKPLLVFISILTFSVTAHAQTGGIIYYLTNSGKLVSTKDSANYSMVVLPPDTSVDKTMYIVREYYKNGKLMMVTGSRTNDVNLKYQGNYISYFMNGSKRKIGIFVDNNPVGNETSYYPNGKLYAIKNYSTDSSIPDKRLTVFKECRDSTGKVLTANGSGQWIEFAPDFKSIIAKGKIANGRKVSMWDIFANCLSIKGEDYNDDGVLLANNTGTENQWVAKGIPYFPGGIKEFANVLLKKIRYPVDARKNGTQGKVIVSFIIEADGQITGAHITKGIGDGCDEEALRLVSLMPKWNPAIKDGKPIQFAANIIIGFTLGE